MKKTTIINVSLTKLEIDSSLQKVEVGLSKYLIIQEYFKELEDKPLSSNIEFRRRFNGFYRIRQKPAQWYNTFYELLDESRGKSVDFSIILYSLHKATNRYEASFASKLMATLNPQMPVIDSIVLKNLNTRLPYYSDPNRFDNICSLYTEISRCYTEYLQSEQGRYLVTQFRKVYPSSAITEVKMLDLVLWQAR
ncbi:hypothetical protein [Spirosoma flavum]|uniref:Uncharacterized protein n=1 Tax=Spirosoma flavum TaxID=2048557 RepID=A0ABW6ATA4_9BACT